MVMHDGLDPGRQLGSPRRFGQHSVNRRPEEERSVHRDESADSVGDHALVAGREAALQKRTVVAARGKRRMVVAMGRERDEGRWAWTSRMGKPISPP